MRENRIAIYWSSGVIILSLAVSILLHCFGYEYVSNIFSGIFASGVLALMIAIINYTVARRRTLESFYSYAMKAAANYNLFENNDDLERSIDSVLLMNQFDYLGLDTAYGDMCFLFRNKENHKYIYDNIYAPTLELRRIISEKCFHFKEYRKAVNGNVPVMNEFINEIDLAIMARKVISEMDGDSMVQTVSVKNRIVEKMHTELTGKYYEIMYGKRVKKEE